MSLTTHLSPDERDALAKAGEEALNLCLGRFVAEERAAFWHAIRCCYVQSPKPAPKAPQMPAGVPVTAPEALPLPDLAALPDPAAIPAPHVIQAAADL
ncbi:hypothetical protein [Methylobacterium isbiliense]|jgi:hypothetical protein|uniref:Uncharacterized protein n=1 Tax=Methylobacterium isbiliense TaxID=315478 RepID=A0ABQ4SII7_9HYPH|nr:hypothetical protein [Methylobacterium isbiliense]MDN3622407.1 hypothetical protein [Methylobacterium isbiliense]GJE01563.1 hypothetical protein GMJLKIPL_3497 [Methylobacterium isbiliense]